jgi:hypothetical protein
MKYKNYVINKLPYIDIIKDYKDGKSIISLSKQYKCGQGTITRLLKTNNINLRTIQESVGGVYIAPQEVSKIKSLYLSGKTKEEICQLYNCSIGTLRAYLKNHNIIKRQVKSWGPIFEVLRKNKQDVINLYNQYKSLTPLIQKYNYDFAVLAAFMDKEGIIRKNNIHNTIPIEDKDKLHNLHHKEMYTMYQIAKLYNCTAPTVAAFFDKNNISRRSAAETSAITAQNPETIRKQRKSMATHKEYKLPSGRIIKLQGYEPQFLDYCFKNKLIKENDFNFDTIMKFPYNTSDGKLHYYYPDFYLPELNTIVETKSWYILERKQSPEIQLLKAQAVKNAGYNYLFILDNDFTPLDKFLIDYPK